MSTLCEPHIARTYALRNAMSPAYARPVYVRVQYMWSLVHTHSLHTHPPYTHVHSAHSPFHKGVFVRVQCLPSPHTLPLTQLQSKRDHWEIDFLQLKIKEKIGSGSYGTVYKSEWHGVFFLSILVSIPVGRKAVSVTLFKLLFRCAVSTYVPPALPVCKYFL